jgi:hypothetical protein
LHDVVHCEKIQLWHQVTQREGIKMDIQALLDAINEHDTFDANSHPKDFEAICCKLVLKDREYFKENFLDHLAEMDDKVMDALYDDVKMIGNDLRILGVLDNDRTRHSYATAVAMESGHAMGRIMQAYQDGIALYVKSSINLWWDDLCGYIYEMDERASHVSLVRDGEL